MTGKNRIVLLIFFIAAVLRHDSLAAGDGEYRALVEERKALSVRVEALKAEQDFLLFQKLLYASDSKYLILNMGAKKGQLRYKNRVLRDYPFLSMANGSSVLNSGPITLTKKIEGPRKKHALVFGKSLILQAKGATIYREAGTLRIALSKRDFSALYYALENGALAYILP